MNEWLIAAAALAAGAAIAWLWRSSLASAALDAVVQQLGEKNSEVAELKSAQSCNTDLLRAESERRAAAADQRGRASGYVEFGHLSISSPLDFRPAGRGVFAI